MSLGGFNSVSRKVRDCGELLEVPTLFHNDLVFWGFLGKSAHKEFPTLHNHRFPLGKWRFTALKMHQFCFVLSLPLFSRCPKTASPHHTRLPSFSTCLPSLCGTPPPPPHPTVCLTSSFPDVLLTSSVRLNSTSLQTLPLSAHADF